MRPTRLTRVVPLTIVVSAVLAALVGLGVGTALAREAAFDEGERSGRSRLGHNQPVLEAALRRDDQTLIEEILATIGGDRAVQRAAVIGSNGLVLASSRLIDRGEALERLDWPRDATSVVTTARGRHGPVFERDPEGLSSWGAIPLTDPHSGTAAVLVIEGDVAPTYAAGLRQVQVATGLFVALMLVVAALSAVVLQRVLASRTAPVFTAARRLAQGDLAARTGLTGDDEVGQLARAFDDMAARLEERQRATVEAEQRYHTIFEQAADGIFLSTADGRYVDANPAALALCGYTLEELRARTIFDLSAPEEAAPRVDELRRRGRLTASRSVVTKSGERVPVELGAVMLADGGLLSVVRDLRPRFEADRLRAQVAANERLALLGQLAAGVGHEINNPLTFVLAHLESAVRQLPPGALQTELAEARDGAERISRIVADLRVFGRGEEEAAGPVALEKVVRTALNLSGPAVRDRLTVVVDVPAELPRVHAAERRLCQVVLNLVQNATLAMPEGRPAEGNELVLAARQRGREVELEVRDNGVGMTPEVLGRIFEPYFTTRARTGGTGLGLAISRELLVRMSARIEATSTPGLGTTFVLTFAVDETPVAAEASARPAPEPSAAVTARRVLIIDDEPAVARVAARLLREHDVTLADGPATGLEACRGASFDLILCDLSMPGGGGAHFFAELKAQRPELAERVAFVTGGAASEEVARFLEETRQPVVQKPFDPATLRALAAGKG